MPRGIPNKGRKTTAKKAATPRKPRRKTVDVAKTDEIPTISASLIRTSLHSRPAAMPEPAPIFNGELMDADDTLYAVYRDESDNDGIDWQNTCDTDLRTLDQAIASAEETADEDECTTYVVQIVAIVAREKKLVVKRLNGAGPA